MKPIFVFITILFLTVEANKISKDIFTKCKKHDLNLSKCLTDSANKGWPKFVKAYKLDKIPVDNIYKDIPNLAKGNMTGNIFGLQDITFHGIYMNFAKKTIDVIYSQPTLEIIADYEAKGGFLGLKIDEHGDVNMTFSKGIYNYHLDYEIEERDGQEYIQLTKSRMQYNVARLYVYTTSIDHPETGKQMTALFNNYWRIVNIIIEDTFSEVFSDTYLPYIREYFSKVPLKSLFRE